MSLRNIFYIQNSKSIIPDETLRLVGQLSLSEKGNTSSIADKYRITDTSIHRCKNRHKMVHAALKVFHQTDSVSEPIRLLRYPTRKQLYNWIVAENVSLTECKPIPRIANPPEHPRNPHYFQRQCHLLNFRYQYIRLPVLGFLYT